MSAICGLCGEPMPKGEEMFNYHGYSGNCPKPPLPMSSSEPSRESRLLDAIDAIRKKLDNEIDYDSPSVMHECLAIAKAAALLANGAQSTQPAPDQKGKL
jgi:hypothetical protein